MESLKEIHNIALPELKKKFTLDPVSLKYPFPERPLRTLGLVRINGDVFSSEKFSPGSFFENRSSCLFSSSFGFFETETRT